MKIALILCIERQKPELAIEKWVRSSTGKPRCEQRVVVKKFDDNIIVRGSPLKIEFENLFLRESHEPEERDIFEDEELKYLAGQVWQRQGFCQAKDHE